MVVSVLGWMGVPLGPAFLVVSIWRAFDAVGISIINCAAAGDTYCAWECVADRT